MEFETNLINRRGFISTTLLGTMGLMIDQAAEAAPLKTEAWKDKVVLITGATSGLGKFMAQAFSAQGAKVAFCGRRSEQGIALQKQWQKEGSETSFFKADIRVESEVKNLVESTVKKYGRIDLAINNAGIDFESNSFHTDSMKKHLDVIETNLIGTMFCLRYEMEQMRKQKSGSVVNIASTASVRGADYGVSYSASKHGVIGLTRSLAKAHGKDNIRVNAISTYRLNHEMGSGDKPLNENTQDVIDAKSRIPLGRLMTFQDAFQATAWLGSDSASIITGQNLILDGGLLA